LTIVIVVCVLMFVVLSTMLAVGLGRAAARGDEGLNEDLALLRARARERAAAGVRPNSG
jgi:hypothetical protein